MKEAQGFPGTSGIKEVYDQTLKVKEPTYGFTDFEAMAQLLGSEWMWSYAKCRAEEGIIFHCIAGRSSVAIEAEKRSQQDKRPMRFADVASGIELYVQGDKVIELNFADNFGRVIEDAQLAKTVKAAWQKIWDSSLL
jgi:hypothetical protein